MVRYKVKDWDWEIDGKRDREIQIGSERYLDKKKERNTHKDRYRSGLGNVRPAGHMRPAKHLNVAREPFVSV